MLASLVLFLRQTWDLVFLSSGIVTCGEDKAEIKERLHRYKRQLRQKSTRNLFILACAMVLFFSLLFRWDTPMDKFKRINNVCTLAWLWLEVLLARGTTRRARLMFDVVYIICILQFSTYTTLTEDRTAKLLDRVFGIAAEPKVEIEEQHFQESFGVILSFPGLLVLCTWLKVKLERTFLTLTLVSVCWHVQVSSLGTALTSRNYFALSGAYGMAELLIFIAARHTSITLLQEFQGRAREISGVMRIMQHASVPIALVSMSSSGELSSPQLPAPSSSASCASPTSSASVCSSSSSKHSSLPPQSASTKVAAKLEGLQVDLWNSALESITMVSVVKGTPLQDVPCLRAAHLQAFEASVRLALSPGGGQTKRLLLPLIAAGGTVWLQLDVWPVHLDGNKAMIIGSDVTEFVTKYHSFIRTGAESNPGMGMMRGSAQAPSLGESQMTAQMEPDMMRLEGCSPHFNLLFARQMDGQSLASYIRSEEAICHVRAAAAAAASGWGPQEVTIRLRTATRHLPPDARRRGRRRRRRPAESGDYEEDDDEDELEVALQIVPGYSSLEDTASGDRAILSIAIHNLMPEQPICQSDPGGDLLGARRRELNEDDDQRTRFAPFVASRCAPVAGRQTPWDKRQVAEDRLPAKAVSMEALLGNLVELTRHLGAPNLKDAQQILQVAHLQLCNNLEFLHSRFGMPCKDWQCEFCSAFNDFEDEVCEVCKISQELRGDSEDSRSETRCESSGQQGEAHTSPPSTEAHTSRSSPPSTAPSTCLKL